MVPEVKILGTFFLDTDTLLTELDRIVGSGAVRKLDAVSFDMSKPSGYLALLYYFQNPETKDSPQEAILKSETLKSHIFISFLIHASKETVLHIASNTSLKVTYAGTPHNTYLCVISGTLLGWYLASLLYCKDSATLELRHLFDKIVLLLEKSGYGLIWAKTRRSSLDDGTFILRLK